MEMLTVLHTHIRVAKSLLLQRAREKREKINV